MRSTLSWAAVIVAAGRGTRLGRPKQLLEIAGLPMAGWSMQTFGRMPEIAEIVVVTEEECFSAVHDLAARVVPDREIGIVAGGETRQRSVYYGLRALRDLQAAVLVHDGARPMVRADDVRSGMREVRSGRGALLAAPVVDTIKVVDAHSKVVTKTLDRGTLWAAQTPQFALLADLLRAHAAACGDAIEATDDAALLERIGVEMVVVPSTAENFKVTHPEDIARAEACLRERVGS
ncbi:MAG: 2-C-methyl-D-erythritol 4-phosphate cytidylyltransferase [Candidatus Eremiobacteraeota bacterium]|nr:2-C-methyl-D-erythritol 4-phosphate cytidylyltransferase [Candidatus Eremiobacteraeota bacterium]